MMNNAEKHGIKIDSLTFRTLHGYGVWYDPKLKGIELEWAIDGNADIREMMYRHQFNQEMGNE